MDIYDARDEVRTRLAEARAAAKQIPQLEEQLAGLDSYIRAKEAEEAQRHYKLPEPPEDSPEDWVALTRPEAVLRVLRRADKGLSPREIDKQLKEMGRDTDNPHNIGTALARLRKRGQVRSGGYGRWHAKRTVSSVPVTQTRTLSAVKGGDAS